GRDMNPGGWTRRVGRLKALYSQESNKFGARETDHFNSILPNDFPYLQEPTIFNLETKTPDIYFIPKGVNLIEYLNNIPTPEPFKKRFLSLIIDRVFKRSNISETSKMLDDIKNLGFKYSTMSGVTISHADINVYSKKAEVISQVEDKITEIEKWHVQGF
ncbi:MAG: hypothetical protein Q8855_02780, partial [Candidatus Phytoplasma australasiaticum]|nr:hypothetical protein [Candidatus Phytoplasma australasiaticum]